MNRFKGVELGEERDSITGNERAVFDPNFSIFSRNSLTDILPGRMSMLAPSTPTTGRNSLIVPSSPSIGGDSLFDQNVFEDSSGAITFIPPTNLQTRGSLRLERDQDAVDAAAAAASISDFLFRDQQPSIWSSSFPPYLQDLGATETTTAITTSN